MAIGANNAIDKRLVELYANKQTICAETSSKMDPEKVWDSMQMLSVTNQAFITINNKKFNKMKIA